MSKRLIDLPVGAKVKDSETTYYGKTIVWQIADKNHAGYPKNSITLISEKILCIKCMDANEPNNNIELRRKFGNNRYKHSNINIWLNSSGNWYRAQHSQDAPPTAENTSNGDNPYADEMGFLTGFSSNFKNSMKETVLTVKKPNVDGGSTETITAKIFLASHTELGLTYGSAIEGESRFAIFSDSTSRFAYPTAEAVKNSTYKSVSTFKRVLYWLRTNDIESVYEYYITVNYDHNNDAYGISAANYSWECGIRPLCNVGTDIRVSDEPDSDGVYIIEWNYLPQITIEAGTNLGLKNAPFSLPYTVSDKNTGQKLFAKEFINGVQKRSYIVENGKNYTLKVTEEEWREILNTTNILKLVVEDEDGGKTEKSFTFLKNETEIEFQLKKPLPADDKITKAIVNIISEIPADAIMTVEICNNAFDTSPIWEDVTSAVKRKTKVFLHNTSKTASKWGFNVRIKVKRNGATGNCFIASIGGNFE